MNLLSVFTRIQHLEIVSRRFLDGLLGGEYRSLFRGPGLEFHQVRAYDQGDDIRSIDWNVSSRMNDVFVKTWREERELSVFLVMDLSRSITVADNRSLRETMDLVLAIFAFAATNNGDKVGACFYSDQVEFWSSPARGRAQALRLTRSLLTHQVRGKGSDLTLALRTVLESLHRRSIVVVVSDFKTEGYQKEMSMLVRRHDVIAVRLVPRDDLDFPDQGTFWMQDPESGTSMPAYGGSANFRYAYRDFWTGERKKWFQDCRRRGVSALEIGPEDDPLTRLHQFFIRRRRRRN